MIALTLERPTVQMHRHSTPIHSRFRQLGLARTQMYTVLWSSWWIRSIFFFEFSHILTVIGCLDSAAHRF